MIRLRALVERLTLAREAAPIHACTPPDRGDAVWTCPECREIWTRFWGRSGVKANSATRV